MNQEHAFCLAIEKLLGIEVPRRAQLIRVLYCEIGRILSHLLNVTTQALDVGALTPPLWGFEEREKLMVFYERASGARLHANYFRPGGVHIDCPKQLDRGYRRMVRPVPQGVDDLTTFSSRTASSSSATSISASSRSTNAGRGAFPAPVIAGRALAWDLRKAQPYECYEEMDFDIPVGSTATTTSGRSCAWRRCGSPCAS